MGPRGGCGQRMGQTQRRGHLHQPRPQVGRPGQLKYLFTCLQVISRTLSYPFLTLLFQTLSFLTLLFQFLPFLTWLFLSLSFLTLLFQFLPFLTLLFLSLSFLTLLFQFLPVLTFLFLFLSLLTLLFQSLSFTDLALPVLILTYLAI